MVFLASRSFQEVIGAADLPPHQHLRDPLFDPLTKFKTFPKTPKTS
ncbi:hypothetical protein RBSWK_02422 [Rhodopirellula baltica SWK14]|uniref:Uncharacterized protein n=1 Tax=Rhodopirellula baltica SWK14 TaxID=993516 RepID=L7CI81_RHOBT|nr:hypothetical protein RBSWK_02422 [Rhodopirellula baltica SWK14]